MPDTRSRSVECKWRRCRRDPAGLYVKGEDLNSSIEISSFGDIPIAAVCPVVDGEAMGPLQARSALLMLCRCKRFRTLLGR